MIYFFFNFNFYLLYTYQLRQYDVAFSRREIYQTRVIRKNNMVIVSVSVPYLQVSNQFVSVPSSTSSIINFLLKTKKSPIHISRCYENYIWRGMVSDENRLIKNIQIFVVAKRHLNTRLEGFFFFFFFPSLLIIVIYK